MKKCTKCKDKKPSQEFGQDHRYSDGLRVECRRCENERSKAYHKKKKRLLVDYFLGF